MVIDVLGELVYTQTQTQTETDRQTDTHTYTHKTKASLRSQAHAWFIRSIILAICPKASMK